MTFIIDNCITVKAGSLSEANTLADEIKDVLLAVVKVQRDRAPKRSAFAHIENINICHVEEVPEEAPIVEPVGLVVAQ